MKWTPEDHDVIRELRLEGATWSDIGQYFGVSRNVINGVWDRMRAYGAHMSDATLLDFCRCIDPRPGDPTYPHGWTDDQLRQHFGMNAYNIKTLRKRMLEAMNAV